MEGDVGIWRRIYPRVEISKDLSEEVTLNSSQEWSYLSQAKGS